MTIKTKRIAINAGGGYVPGLNAAVTGTVLAATRLGWEVVGIRDGYDGLLFRDRYPDGGLIRLGSGIVEDLSGAPGSILGTAARTDPFRARTLNLDNQVEEIDRSDELLKVVRTEKIDAVISIVGASAITGSHALTVAFKLSRKGLSTVCIPKSIENDITGTALSFGYNSALSYTTETLERIRTGARDVRRLAIVEVPGQHAGWLALQAGMAVCADAVLIPEIPYDLRKVATRLLEKQKAGGTPALIVVAEGAKPKTSSEPAPTGSAGAQLSTQLRRSLSPLSDPQFGEGARVIERAGIVAEEVALKLQRMTDLETFPLLLGQLVRGGAPTAVDRQLGLGYGAGAVRALSNNQSGVMVAFQPPDLHFVPLAEAINRFRTVPQNSEFVEISRALGISLGD
jgi:ATP-dependent phosphofructokinase / diphosphate-dependent phosphofructokinase